MEFRVRVSGGFRFQGSSFRVRAGLGFGLEASPYKSVSFRGLGSKVRVLGFRLEGASFRVRALRFGIAGLRLEGSVVGLVRFSVPALKFFDDLRQLLLE